MSRFTKIQRSTNILSIFPQLHILRFDFPPNSASRAIEIRVQAFFSQTAVAFQFCAKIETLGGRLSGWTIVVFEKIKLLGIIYRL